jgi:hypothetical protein
MVRGVTPPTLRECCTACVAPLRTLLAGMDMLIDVLVVALSMVMSKSHYDNMSAESLDLG